MDNVKPKSGGNGTQTKESKTDGRRMEHVVIMKVLSLLRTGGVDSVDSGPILENRITV